MEIPNIGSAIPNETRLFDILPNETHYHKIKQTLHPDIGSNDNHIQDVLNRAFDIWRPFLEDPQLANETVPYHDPESSNEFCVRSTKHSIISEMYDAYLLAYGEVLGLVNPSVLSPKLLDDALQALSVHEFSKPALDTEAVESIQRSVGAREEEVTGPKRRGRKPKISQDGNNLAGGPRRNRGSEENGKTREDFVDTSSPRIRSRLRPRA